MPSPVEEVQALRTRRTTTVALALAVLLLASSLPASAAPTVSSKRAEAERVKAQVETLDQKVEAAAEDYNEARTRYTEVSAKVKRTRAHLDKVRKRIGVLQTHLSTRMEGMYRSGPLSFVEVLLGARDFEQFSSTWDMLKDMNQDDAAAVEELKTARAEAEAAERKLKADQGEARKALGVMTDRKRSIEAQLASRKSMLRGLEGEIVALQRAERQAAVRRASTRKQKSYSSLWDWGNPKRAPRSEVVQIAMRYLGAPYRWGAAGPNAFDCSGFTMFVYAQVGVRLPHSSRAQISCGERVSRANLQPGDLVFFGSPIHHVGIYVGGGRYIHAPHSGDVVSIDALDRRDYAGACRP